MKMVCVFCGSSFGEGPFFVDIANSVADAMIQRSLGLVYGGGARGLMGQIAKRIDEAGLPVVGIAPTRFHKSADPIYGETYIIVDTMHERKSLMYKHSDMFLTLPGGIGTLEEIAEIFTWNTIGFSGKPVALLNSGGFYNPFIEQLELMVQSGFLSKEKYARLIVKDTIEEALDTLLVTPQIEAAWDLTQFAQHS